MASAVKVKSGFALAELDLDRRLKDEASYQQKLRKLQIAMLELEEIYRVERRRGIIALEGWDASGKSGAIQRLIEKLDPRWVQVWSIGRPSPEQEVRDTLNRSLRGWSNYFCYGTRRSAFRSVDRYTYERVRDFRRSKAAIISGASGRGYRFPAISRSSTEPGTGECWSNGSKAYPVRRSGGGPMTRSTPSRRCSSTMAFVLSNCSCTCARRSSFDAFVNGSLHPPNIGR